MSASRPRGRAAVRALAVVVAVVLAACGATAPSGSAPGSASAAPPPSGDTPSAPPSGTPSSSPSQSPGASPSPTSSQAATPSGQGVSTPPPGPVTVRPASAHGKVISLAMAAPWRGGRFNQANVALYLPPHFSTSGSVRYPVVYEAPYGISTWRQPNRFNLPLVMDSLIAQRLIPPTIVVMLGTSGGPYLDSECANSYDGRAWIETWIVKTIVPWMDRTYPTVASRAGRAVMGASQGAYCAAALWSHHPDVFGAAIIESGYFTSGIRSTQTPNAWMPFGGNAAYEASQSPILRVPGIPASLRAASLVLLEADPSNWFYGAQTKAFIAVLDAAGVPNRLYADPAGHSWTAFARDTPRMLADWGRWLAGQGVR